MEWFDPYYKGLGLNLLYEASVKFWNEKLS